MLPSYEETISRMIVPEDQLNGLKQQHSKTLKKSLYWFYSITLVTVVVCLFTLDSDDSGLLWPILTILVWLICLYRVFHRIKTNKQAYKLEFKHTVVGPLADTILKLAELPNETKDYKKYCDYNPEQFINLEWIKMSQLFETEIDDIHGEDLFFGKYGLTDFQFSELKMTRKDETTDTDGHTTTTTTTIFDGVLFIADFKKHFSGLTLVETKLFKSDRGFGKLAGKMFNRAVSIASKSANHKIELENSEFNRNFMTRTTNEIEARYILSPVMMEQILDFVHQHPNAVSMSFHHSYMFIAVASKKNFFDEGIGNKQGPYHLEGIYNDLTTFFRIIEEFDLNTRIWSKK